MSVINACYAPAVGKTASVVELMRSASDYWSPDAYSEASDANEICTLAKASLFNTELSKSDGVYQDHDSGLIITANARIDNRVELGAQLGLADSEIATLPDGQLILRAYQHWGDACPKQLRGDFVFAIWDEAQKRLFCARDHFGVKVLLYACTERGVLVTNEHNALFTSQWVSKTINQKWLVTRLWGLGPSPFESPYEGVEVLPAAHTLVIDSEGARVQRYWQLEDSHAWEGMGDEALIAELRKRFEQAVARRLDSDYPLGAELSEGLDSNGIVGAAARAKPDSPLYTFSYQCVEATDQNRGIWDDTYKDIYDMHGMHNTITPVWESADSVAVAFNEDEKADFFRCFGGVLDIFGGHFLRSRIAEARGVRTLLSGWGGDHCVSSYGDFHESELFSQGKLVALYELLKGKHRRGRGTRPDKAFVLLILKHWAPFLFRHLSFYRSGLACALRRQQRLHWLKPSLREKFSCDKRLKQFIDNYSRYSVKAGHRRELFDVGVEKRLVESELCGRLSRVEYRYPMLDVDLVEFAYNAPGHLKHYKGVERYMFRRILEGLTTPRVQWRVKSDVDHPKLDRGQGLTETVNTLKDSLTDNAFVERYCDASKLQSFLSSVQIAPQLRGLNMLAQLASQDAPCASPSNTNK